MWRAPRLCHAVVTVLAIRASLADLKCSTLSGQTASQFDLREVTRQRARFKAGQDSGSFTVLDCSCDPPSVAATFDGLAASMDAVHGPHWREASMLRLHRCDELQFSLDQGSATVSQEMSGAILVVENITELNVSSLGAGLRGEGARRDQGTFCSMYFRNVALRVLSQQRQLDLEEKDEILFRRVSLAADNGPMKLSLRIINHVKKNSSVIIEDSNFPANEFKNRMRRRDMTFELTVENRLHGDNCDDFQGFVSIRDNQFGALPGSSVKLRAVGYLRMEGNFIHVADSMAIRTDNVPKFEFVGNKIGSALSQPVIRLNYKDTNDNICGLDQGLVEGILFADNMFPNFNMAPFTINADYYETDVVYEQLQVANNTAIGFCNCKSASVDGNVAAAGDGFILKSILDDSKCLTVQSGDFRQGLRSQICPTGSQVGDFPSPIDALPVCEVTRNTLTQAEQNASQARHQLAEAEKNVSRLEEKLESAESEVERLARDVATLREDVQTAQDREGTDSAQVQLLEERLLAVQEALGVSEAKVQEAENRVLEAEAKAQESETRAQVAEARAAEAEAKAAVAEARAEEAEARAREAEARGQAATAPTSTTESLVTSTDRSNQASNSQSAESNTERGTTENEEAESTAPPPAASTSPVEEHRSTTENGITETGMRSTQIQEDDKSTTPNEATDTSTNSDFGSTRAQEQSSMGTDAQTATDTSVAQEVESTSTRETSTYVTGPQGVSSTSTQDEATSTSPNEVGDTSVPPQGVGSTSAQDGATSTNPNEVGDTSVPPGLGSTRPQEESTLDGATDSTVPSEAGSTRPQEGTTETSVLPEMTSTPQQGESTDGSSSGNTGTRPGADSTTSQVGEGMNTTDDAVSTEFTTSKPEDNTSETVVAQDLSTTTKQNVVTTAKPEEKASSCNQCATTIVEDCSAVELRAKDLENQLRQKDEEAHHLEEDVEKKWKQNVFIAAAVSAVATIILTTVAIRLSCSHRSWITPKGI